MASIGITGFPITSNTTNVNVRGTLLSGTIAHNQQPASQPARIWNQRLAATAAATEKLCSFPVDSTSGTNARNKSHHVVGGLIEFVGALTAGVVGT